MIYGSSLKELTAALAACQCCSGSLVPLPGVLSVLEGSSSSPVPRAPSCSSRLPVGKSIVRYCSDSKHHLRFGIQCGSGDETYEWQAAVCAPADLWLIDVDEDSGVTQWTSSTVARDLTSLDPAHGLFVNQLNGCIRSWL